MVRDRIATMEDGALFLSVISIGEIAKGIHLL